MNNQAVKQYSPIAQSIYNFVNTNTHNWYEFAKRYVVKNLIKIRRLNLKEKTCKTYDNIFVAAKANKTTSRRLRNLIKKNKQVGDFLFVKV